MDVAPLVAALQNANRLVVLTGAGMGLASGIPTFRGTDPDAVWGKDVTELGTHRYFKSDPAGSWRWYRSRFAGLEAARPNAGHHALVLFERFQVEHNRDFLLVTQNIDTLHAQAGSERLVEVHGRADRVRCSAVGCRFAAPRGSLARADVDFGPFDCQPVDANLPRCPVCNARLRAHVLWFDEYYTDHEDYQFARAREAIAAADLILCVGTSFSVGITQAALEAPGTKWTIDPSGAPPPRGVQVLAAPQEEALPAIMRALGL